MASAAAIRAASAYVDVHLRDNIFNRQLKGFEARLVKFGNRMRAMGSKLFGFGAAAMAPLGLSAKTFAGFDDLVQEFRALNRAADPAKVNKTIKQIETLGRTTSFTAQEVADSAINLSRLGFSLDEIQKSLGGVLSVARATRTELPRATQIAGDLMRSFGIDSTDARSVTKFLDELVYTTNNSSQRLEEMFEAMKMIGPQARALNIPVKQILAINAALADAGVKGTLAGTAIRRMLVNLTDPQRMKYLREQFNINPLDDNGNLRTDVANLVREIYDAMRLAGHGTGEIGAEFAKIFEVRGQVPAFVISQSIGKINEFQKSLKNAAGEARRTADTIERGLGNQFKILWSAVVGVGNAIGKSLKKGLVDLMKEVTRWLNLLAEWVEKNPKLIQQYAMIAAGVMTLGGLMLAAAIGAYTLASAVGLVSTVFAVLTTPVSLLLGAFLKLSGLVMALGNNFAKTLIGPLWKAVVGFATLKTTVFGLIGTVFKVFTGLFKAAVVFELVRGVIFTFKTAIANVQEAFTGFGAVVSQMSGIIAKAWASGDFITVITSVADLIYAVLLRTVRAVYAFALDMKNGFMEWVDSWWYVGKSVGSVLTYIWESLKTVFGGMLGMGAEWSKGFADFFSDFAMNASIAALIARRELEKFGNWVGSFSGGYAKGILGEMADTPAKRRGKVDKAMATRAVNAEMLREGSIHRKLMEQSIGGGKFFTDKLSQMSGIDKFNLKHWRGEVGMLARGEQTPAEFFKKHGMENTKIAKFMEKTGMGGEQLAIHMGKELQKLEREHARQISHWTGKSVNSLLSNLERDYLKNKNTAVDDRIQGEINKMIQTRDTNRQKRIQDRNAKLQDIDAMIEGHEKNMLLRKKRRDFRNMFTGGRDKISQFFKDNRDTIAQGAGGLLGMLTGSGIMKSRYQGKEWDAYVAGVKERDAYKNRGYVTSEIGSKQLGLPMEAEYQKKLKEMEGRNNSLWKDWYQAPTRKALGIGKAAANALGDLFGFGGGGKKGSGRLNPALTTVGTGGFNASSLLQSARGDKTITIQKSIEENTKGTLDAVEEIKRMQKQFGLKIGATS